MADTDVGTAAPDRFHEHVIRNERELNGMREYIANNPLQWHLDRENPDRLQQVRSERG